MILLEGNIFSSGRYCQGIRFCNMDEQQNIFFLLLLGGTEAMVKLCVRPDSALT